MARRPTRTAPLALHPLAMALVAVWPLESLAQAATRPVAPPPTAVPLPAATWRVFGSGSPAPVNMPNPRGGVDQLIEQSSQRAIYHWQRFDIGAESSVTFRLPGADSSALNRVRGPGAPSAIFGRLRSEVPNPDAGKPGQAAYVTGGQLYLLNGSGVLFGRDAQVNVGSLIASTLNMADSDFLDGLRGGLLGRAPSFFRGGGDLGLPAAGSGFVQVDAGANITTASGGRVFLFAEEVDNAGTISTPGGQTVLAGGREVYLQLPTRERLYASEVNSAVPAVRGLLVEVGGDAGRVTHRGSIVTEGGNATLVGLAVNQQGLVRATTTVSQNGSILLLARGKTQVPVSGDEDNIPKRASEGGTLTLGPGSRTEILPGSVRNADGSEPTSNDAAAATSGGSAFTTSRVELSGRQIELQAGAAVVAPGGIVRARAESVPDYQLPQTATLPTDAPVLARPFDPAARLVIGDGAVIDVAGTRDASASVARHFVTTELLGSNDLKDAPLQKDGPLFRERATFDLREGVPILGDLSSYRAGVQRTVAERLSAGGQVLLESTGAVVTHEGSRIDLSGGQVRYDAALVDPSVLTAADGTRYTLNQAPADVAYSALSSAGSSAETRWGAVPRYGQAEGGRFEAGYVEGRAAGTLRVLGQQAELGGQVSAGTVTGERQAAGRDALPAAGTLQLGLPLPDATGFGASIVLGRPPQPLGSAFWSDPLAAPLEPGRPLSLGAGLLGSFGRLSLAGDGGIATEPGVPLVLPDRASLSLYARGAEGITLAGPIVASGGSVVAQTVEDVAAGSAAGRITVTDGGGIDVAGRVVNRRLDGPAAPGSAQGGSISLRSGAGLVVAEGSVLDASGGATVAAGGALAAGSPGAITLSSQPVAGVPGVFEMDGDLRAWGLARGGSLTLRAPDIGFGGGAGLLLDAGFLSAGGFENFTLDGYRSLTVADGTRLAPELHNAIALPELRNAASGTRLLDAATPGVLPDGQRRAVNLTLQASGSPQLPLTGALAIGRAAELVLDPGAALTLRAAESLQVAGTLSAPGGSVVLAATPTAGTRGLLQLADSAQVDVSGVLQAVPSADGLVRGRVLDGGTVRLSASQLDVAEGARLAARGARGTVDAGATGPAYAEGARDLASRGGRVDVTLDALGSGEQRFDATLDLAAGGAGAASGALNVAITQTDITTLAPHTLRVTADGGGAGLAGKSLTLSAERVATAGAGELNLVTLDRIEFDGALQLSTERRLTVDAPTLALGAGADVTLQSATVALGNTGLVQDGRTAAAGSGVLTVRAAPAAGAPAEGISLDLRGNLALDGVASATLHSAADLRLHGVGSPAGTVGSLTSPGAVTLAAGQVSATTGTRFTLAADRIALQRPADALDTGVPLSASASITLQARRIDQGGTLRAPLGTVSLQAGEQLTLAPGSITSVAGSAATVPYGSTEGGEDWTYGNVAVGTPAKRIDLTAPSVAVQPGATLDLRGGGEVAALEFVAGPGGSRDIFAGAAGGAWAIVPGVASAAALAPLDRQILEQADASGALAQIPAGQRLVLSRDTRIGDRVLPAGSYALLPARYAVLDGAFLVRPDAGPAQQATLANGAVRVGARLASAGTATQEAYESAFVITPSALARRSSEIRVTEGARYFEAVAEREGRIAGGLARDGGALNVATTSLGFQGTVAMAGADAGRGGTLGLAAGQIAVGRQPVPAGTLLLDPERLAGIGADRLLFGGRDDGTGTLTTLADTLTLQAGSTLQGRDVVLLAREQLRVEQGARVVAPAAAEGAPAGDALVVQGGGAGVRVAEGAALLARRDAGARSGRVELAAGSRLQGGGITVEATGSTAIDPGAELSADRLTLGAGRVRVGGGALPGEPVLSLDGTLLDTAAAASHLTLRAYGEIGFADGARLGSAALQALVLDAPELRVDAGSQAAAQAQQLTLTNTSGGSAGTTAGGRLDLQASAGVLTLGPGAVALSAAEGALTARDSVVLDGTGALAAAGRLTLGGASLTATTGADYRVGAAGDLAIAPGAGRAAVPGQGAAVQLSGRSVTQGGTVDLPAGTLHIAGAEGVRFAPGSVTSVAGPSLRLDGVAVPLPGGSVQARSTGGDVTVAAGARIDASAPQGARAGRIELAAPAGRVAVEGSLVGQGQGGELAVDAGRSLDPSRIAGQLQGFDGALSLRQRQGDLELPASLALDSARIDIAADGGRIDVQGRLSADERLQLAAGTGLALAEGARLQAGERIVLATQDGTLRLAAGASLVGDGDTVLQLRSPRTGVTAGTPGGTGVAIEAPIGAAVEGLGGVLVEAVKRYDGVDEVIGAARPRRLRPRRPHPHHHPHHHPRHLRLRPPWPPRLRRRRVDRASPRLGWSRQRRPPSNAGRRWPSCGR